MNIIQLACIIFAYVVVGWTLTGFAKKSGFPHAYALALFHSNLLVDNCSDTYTKSIRECNFMTKHDYVDFFFAALLWAVWYALSAILVILFVVCLIFKLTIIPVFLFCFRGFNFKKQST